VLERAYAEGRAAAATDDAALVERLGVTVRLVPDSSRNLKVTSAEDLAMAELMAGRDA
jgi:2-C-methyl-D-erythritol 4-phosphate cytidylyltransferase